MFRHVNLHSTTVHETRVTSNQTYTNYMRNEKNKKYFNCKPIKRDLTTNPNHLFTEWVIGLIAGVLHWLLEQWSQVPCFSTAAWMYWPSSMCPNALFRLYWHSLRLPISPAAIEWMERAVFRFVCSIQNKHTHGTWDPCSGGWGLSSLPTIKFFYLSCEFLCNNLMKVPVKWMEAEILESCSTCSLL